MPTKINRSQTDFAEINDMESALIDLKPTPWGSIVANGQPTVMQDVGALTQRAVDATSSSGVDADGIHLQQDTAALLNSEAFIANILNAGVTRRSFQPKVLFKFGLSQLTDQRVFVGLYAAAAADGVILNSDDPAPGRVGLSFSTSRGDTNFQFVSDDGTTQSLVNSGVAASTAAFYLRVTMNPGSILLEILDSSFAVVGSHTFTTNLPIAIVNLVVFSGLRNLASLSVKSMRQYYINLVNRQ